LSNKAIKSVAFGLDIRVIYIRGDSEVAELLYTLMRDGTRYENKKFMGGKREAETLAQLAKSV
jgi:hypothetical protein